MNNKASFEERFEQISKSKYPIIIDFNSKECKRYCCSVPPKTNMVCGKVINGKCNNIVNCDEQTRKDINERIYYFLKNLIAEEILKIEEGIY